MVGFDGLIKSLRHAEKTLESPLASVRSTITNLTEGGRHFIEDVAALGPAAAPKRRRRRRKLSAEGRAAIAAAQRKRWAKIKASRKSNSQKA